MGVGSSGQLWLRSVTTATTGSTTSSRYFSTTSGVCSCSQVPPTEPSREKTAAGAKSRQSTYPCRIKRPVENTVPMAEESLLVPRAKWVGRPVKAMR